MTFTEEALYSDECAGVSRHRAAESGQLRFVPAGWDTLIYVPSIALGPLTRRHLIGLDYFQERNYYLAAALKESNAQIIFVLSRAMQDELLDAHLDLLRRALILSPAALTRLHVLKVEQPPELSLSAASPGKSRCRIINRF
jgi:hypothetical protein